MITPRRTSSQDELDPHDHPTDVFQAYWEDTADQDTADQPVHDGAPRSGEPVRFDQSAARLDEAEYPTQVIEIYRDGPRTGAHDRAGESHPAASHPDEHRGQESYAEESYAQEPFHREPDGGSGGRTLSVAAQLFGTYEAENDEVRDTAIIPRFTDDRSDRAASSESTPHDRTEPGQGGDPSTAAPLPIAGSDSDDEALTLEQPAVAAQVVEPVHAVAPPAAPPSAPSAPLIAGHDRVGPDAAEPELLAGYSTDVPAAGRAGGPDPDRDGAPTVLMASGAAPLGASGPETAEAVAPEVSEGSVEPSTEDAPVSDPSAPSAGADPKRRASWWQRRKAARKAGQDAPGDPGPGHATGAAGGAALAAGGTALVAGGAADAGSAGTGTRGAQDDRTEVIPRLTGPAAEGPAVEGPGVETPGVEGRAAADPGVEAPGVVETPAVETPAVEGSGVEGRAVEAPGVEGRAAAAPGVETPSAEGPGVASQAGEAPAVEGPAVEGSGVEGSGVEGSAGDAQRSRRPMLVGLALLLVTVLAGVGAYLAWSRTPTAGSPSVSVASAGAGGSNDNLAFVDRAATDRVKDQVAAAISAIYSYDSAQLDQSQSRALAHITGSYVDQFKKNFATVRLLAPSQKATLTSTVVETGVESLTQSRATLLVMVNQVGRRAGDPQPLRVSARLSVTAEQVDGQWKVADVVQK